MSDVRPMVRGMIQELLARNSDSRPFSDQDSLVFSGKLQSVDVLDVVVFLEERFQIDFSEEFDQSRLDSVDEIVALIEHRGRLPRAGV